MVGRIFHLNDQDEATPMKETDYDAESTLQELLAKHPDLLAGDQIDSDEPRRWLLVTREMAVASEDGDVERWSLDHLFLDQDAIPTPVEAKHKHGHPPEGCRSAARLRSQWPERSRGGVLCDGVAREDTE